MTAFEILPFILFLVVIGTAISERINIPYPLVLVAAGLVVGFVPGIPNWHPPSNIVLPLFLPPILFAAARLISWEDIRNNLGQIFSLSVLLVIVTTIGIAWILHWAVPSLPLTVALVLGAIVSPTDAIAATSILHRMHAERHIIRRIEVESLFNDAISIVLYNLSVLFVFMGTVNFPPLSIHLLLIGLGGIAIGLLFSYFCSLIIREFLTESENELPIIMGLILAYVAYLFAERIGASGVLSVVTAGLFHKRTERAIQAKTRLSEKSVWDTLVFFLNGLIFIVIGLQFPTTLDKVRNIPTSQLLLFSGLTISILVLLRFFWVTITNYVLAFFHRFRKKKLELMRFSWRDVLISSWSGMRGLVSLALAVALPLTLSDTTPFPFRDLIVFITIITILFTLLVEGLTLPFLIKILKAEKSPHSVMKKTLSVYRDLTEKAIQYVNQLVIKEHQCSSAAKKLVDNYYTNRLLQFQVNYESDCDETDIGMAASGLLSKALDYERDLLHHLRANDHISEEVYIRLLTKLDRDEVGFSSYK